MLNSVLVDIAIGLAVVFFVVASLVAAVNEIVTRALDIRAKVLWKALANTVNRSEKSGEPFRLQVGDALRMYQGSERDRRPVVMAEVSAPTPAAVPIDDPTGPASGLLTNHLANTSLIRTLGGRARWSSQRTKVDHIASEIFTAALLEVTQRASGDVLTNLVQARAALRASRSGAGAQLVVSGWTEVTQPGTLAAVLADTGLDPELARPIEQSAARWADAAEAGRSVLGMERISLDGQLEAGIEAVSMALYGDQLTELRLLVRDTPLGAAVEAALARTAGTLDDVLGAVNVWFDQQMAMLSAQYRAAARKVLFVAGIGLAVVLNISAIDLAEDLRDDARGRELLVSAVTTSCPPGAGQDACLEALAAGVDDQVGTITLPVVGTWAAPWQALGIDGDAEDPWWEVGAGWLLTGLAVSLGAPFWFDVAQRLSSRRR